MSITIATPAVVFTMDSARDGAVVFNADSGTIAVPRKLTVRRVLPKKTSTYPGNARNYLKLHWGVTVGTEVYPIIVEMSISRAATMPTGDTDIARDIMGALIADSELDAFFTSLAMPA